MRPIGLSIITGLCYTRCSERCENSAKPGAYNFFDYWYMGVAPKIRGTILGVPKIRIKIFWSILEFPYVVGVGRDGRPVLFKPFASFFQVMFG